MHCPHCTKDVNTAYCPDCGLRMEPLRLLLAYCTHRAYEYEKRRRYTMHPPDSEEMACIESLHETWSTYSERLTLAIAALHREEDAHAKQ